MGYAILACLLVCACGDRVVTQIDSCVHCDASSARCGDGHLDPGEECDDGNTLAGDGCSATCTTESWNVAASWVIRTATSSTPLACPVGYDTAAVFSQPVDASGTNIGAPVVDLFNCSAGSGTTAPINAGRYKIWLAIQSHDLTSTYATSTSVIVNLDRDLTFSAQILTDGGYFGLAWDLRGANSNNPLTCAQASASTGIEIISTLSGTSTAYSDTFTCLDGAGITAGVPAGTYTLSIDAVNASMQSTGTAPALTNKVIQAPNLVTDLGTVVIPITGL